MPDSVDEFLLPALETQPNVQWVLLLWLESAPIQRDSPTLGQVLGASSGCRWVDAGLLVPRPMAITLVDGGVFNGFDQVALIETDPGEPPQCPVVFTTDIELDADAERQVRAWLEAVGATAGVADGVGLRVIERKR